MTQLEQNPATRQILKAAGIDPDLLLSFLDAPITRHDLFIAAALTGLCSQVPLSPTPPQIIAQTARLAVEISDATIQVLAANPVGEVPHG
ncbi:hypothetical protein [Anthocerotibacter panamensis]|uniref:hypothetical protein n=1 Tax=Anthocerotibacter panamensis TaxID=2857077 RepID=UPI001C401F43|nr:hypothetical protein [Anthocerotibacter panamensis]